MCGNCFMCCASQHMLPYVLRQQRDDSRLGRLSHQRQPAVPVLDFAVNHSHEMLL